MSGVGHVRVTCEGVPCEGVACEEVTGCYFTSSTILHRKKKNS